MSRRQLAGFAMAGGAGFTTDALVFLALVRLAGMPVMGARVLAFLPATGVTWWLNRHYVFRTAGSTRSRRGEYLRHLAVQAIGISINFAVFRVSVHAGLGAGNANLLPLALGSGIAMVANFLGARWLVFVR